MIFGIPRELPKIKNRTEYRVGLSPMGVKELTYYGAQVYVESKAGEGAGFADEHYKNAGATIVYSKEEIYKRCEIILKVSCPVEEEYSLIKEGQGIMGFIHILTVNAKFIEVIKHKKVTLLGYEIVRKDDGQMPIVLPMSEIAGKLAVQLAARLLESPGGGRGILLGGIPGIPPAEVVIIGGGTLGLNAAKSFAGIGANVYILDIDRKKLENIFMQTNGVRVTTMFATKHNIEKLIKFADVLIAAVLVPGKRTPVLVTKEMVKTMKKGAVIIDFDIDQGGSIETAHVAPCGELIYKVNDVIHFCMPNVTSLLARTATHALTSSIFPYLRQICEQGFEKAIIENKELERGIYAINGKFKKEFEI